MAILEGKTDNQKLGIFQDGLNSLSSTFMGSVRAAVNAAANDQDIFQQQMRAVTDQRNLDRKRKDEERRYQQDFLFKTLEANRRHDFNLAEEQRERQLHGFRMSDLAREERYARLEESDIAERERMFESNENLKYMSQVDALNADNAPISEIAKFIEGINNPHMREILWEHQGRVSKANNASQEEQDEITNRRVYAGLRSNFHAAKGDPDKIFELKQQANSHYAEGNITREQLYDFDKIIRDAEGTKRDTTILNFEENIKNATTSEELDNISAQLNESFRNNKIANSQRERLQRKVNAAKDNLPKDSETIPQPSAETTKPADETDGAKVDVTVESIIDETKRQTRGSIFSIK